MYYSYVEIEYVATNFSPAGTDISVKLLRQRTITTCGDADVTVETIHIDPALCIYIVASFICIANKHLKDKVLRGNGTMCRVIGIHSLSAKSVLVGEKLGATYSISM